MYTNVSVEPPGSQHPALPEQGGQSLLELELLPADSLPGSLQCRHQRSPRWIGSICKAAVLQALALLTWWVPMGKGTSWYLDTKVVPLAQPAVQRK